MDVDIFRGKVLVRNQVENPKSMNLVRRVMDLFVHGDFPYWGQSPGDGYWLVIS